MDECAGGSNVGVACDDTDVCTENDVWSVDANGNCECVGSLIDENNNGTCDFVEPCEPESGALSQTLKANSCNSAQSLSISISEFSNGDTGADEYIELVVKGNGVFDLRGVIVDDKEGGYERGNGYTAGRIRFSDHQNWAEVKGGSLILLYNSKRKNNKIKSDDPADLNGDRIYISSLSQPYFYGEELDEENTYSPIPPDWDLIWLYDKNDEINIRSCDGRLLHKVAYGYNEITGDKDTENTIRIDKAIKNGLAYKTIDAGFNLDTQTSPGEYNTNDQKDLFNNGK